MRTIDDIMADLQAIMDASDAREMTDEEVSRYETLEAELKPAQRREELRSRHAGYAAPVNSGPALITGRVRGEQRPELEVAYEAYLRTGQPNADIADLQVTMAQGEGVSTAGGYTVPSGFRQKLVEVRKSMGGFANHVDSFSTTNGQPIEYPTLDDTANSGSITAESAVISSGADLVFGKVNLGAHKYTSAGAGSNLPLRVSVELLQDSAFDVAGLVARKLGERIARAQAPHWVTGTGAGQPKGILAASLTADRDLDTADTPDYEDLVEFQDLLDEAYEPNAQWLMKKGTWSQLRLIVDTIGRPIIQNLTEGIGEKPRRRLLGSDVIIDESVPTLSSAGDTFCMAYGDFREAYVIRRVSSLVIVVNPYSRATYGEVEYTAWERADGNIQNRSAYKIMQNNT
jgi:HK97 family phage major capsid protein